MYICLYTLIPRGLLKLSSEWPTIFDRSPWCPRYDNKKKNKAQMKKAKKKKK